jgi:hypothetical protein
VCIVAENQIYQPEKAVYLHLSDVVHVYLHGIHSDTNYRDNDEELIENASAVMLAITEDKTDDIAVDPGGVEIFEEGREKNKRNGEHQQRAKHQSRVVLFLVKRFYKAQNNGGKHVAEQNVRNEPKMLAACERAVHKNAFDKP